jgi:hypothetical protein
MGQIYPDAVHLSWDDFKAVVQSVVSPQSSPRPEVMSHEAYVDLVTAMHYPCVRMLLANVNDRCPMVMQDQSFNISFTDALGAVRAAFDANCCVPADSLPPCFPVEPFRGRRLAMVPNVVPRLHFGLWAGLSDALRKYRFSRGICEFPELPQPSFTKEYVHQNAAFKVVGLFMAIFCDPFKQPVRVTVPQPVGEWLPRTQFLLRNGCSVLAGPKLNYHPFKHAASHDEACEGSLSADVVSLLETLQRGDALWLCCGGDAPIDYILIVRNDDETVEVRFMDAKHCSGASDFSSAERREMRRKAKMVHGGLMREVQKKLPQVTVADFTDAHLLIVRNVASPDDLSPATFRWQPWSSIMFRR